MHVQLNNVKIAFIIKLVTTYPRAFVEMRGVFKDKNPLSVLGEDKV